MLTALKQLAHTAAKAFVGFAGHTENKLGVGGNIRLVVPCVKAGKVLKGKVFAPDVFKSLSA